MAESAEYAHSGSSKTSDVKNLSYMGQPLTTFTEIAVLHSYIISLLRDRSAEGSFFIAGEIFAFTTIEKTVGKTKGRERREKALSVTLYGEANIINYQEAVLLDIGLQKLRQVFKI